MNIFPPPDFPTAFFITAAVIFGSMLGSFFNVVIYRMPRGESIVLPASRCPSCGYKIRPWENFPVLAWIMLRGRCSQCRVPISIQYPLVEAACGAWAGLLAWDMSRNPIPIGSALVLFYFGLCAVPITIIDLRHYLIPDALTLTGLVFAVATSFLPGGLTPWESLGGMVISGVSLWALGTIMGKVLKKDAMGFGDVKLLALMGACFGWQTSMLALGAASVLGSLAGIPWLFLRGKNPERHIPFGPFLCLGALLANRFGHSVLEWYWVNGPG